MVLLTVTSGSCCLESAVNHCLIGHLPCSLECVAKRDASDALKEGKQGGDLHQRHVTLDGLDLCMIGTCPSRRIHTASGAPSSDSPLPQKQHVLRQPHTSAHTQRSSILALNGCLCFCRRAAAAADQRGRGLLHAGGGSWSATSGSCTWAVHSPG